MVALSHFPAPEYYEFIQVAFILMLLWEIAFSDIFVLYCEMYFSDKLNQATKELLATEHWIYWSCNRYHKFWLTCSSDKWNIRYEISFGTFILLQKWFLHEASIYPTGWKRWQWKCICVGMATELVHLWCVGWTCEPVWMSSAWTHIGINWNNWLLFVNTLLICSWEHQYIYKVPLMLIAGICFFS